MFGFFFVIAGAVGMELRKDRLLGEWELPENVPVLARVPVMAMKKGGFRPWKRAGAVAVIGGGPGLLAALAARPAVLRGRGLTCTNSISD